MKKTVILAMALVLGTMLAACNGTAPQETASATTGLTISIETAPSPAMMGDVEIQLRIQDSQGTPVTGADVFVFANHTDMSGMIMSGQASEVGNGLYTIRANFSMSGNWVLSVEVKRNGETETQEIPLVIN